MKVKILASQCVKATQKLFGDFGMRQWQHWTQNLEDEQFPLTIPDLLISLLAIGTLIASSLGVLA